MKVFKLGSDDARLADRRVRIVREEQPDEPTEQFDLVFEKAEDEASIPKDAIYKWKFDCSFEHEPIWLFATEERCRKMVSPNPDDWTREKLAGFEKDERKLWQSWWDGDVFGWIREKWDPKKREFVHEASCGGYYGAGEILRAVEEEAVDFAEEPSPGEKDIIVCAEDDLAERLGETGEKPRA